MTISASLVLFPYEQDLVLEFKACHQPTSRDPVNGFLVLNIDILEYPIHLILILESRECHFAFCLPTQKAD